MLPLAPGARLRPGQILVICLGVGFLSWPQGPARGLHAQFAPPSRVTQPGLVTGSFHLGLDFFENVIVAHEEAGRIGLETIVAGSPIHSDLGVGVEPRLAFSLLGTFLAYATEVPGTNGRKIFLRSRAGPEWSAARQISTGSGDDHLPALQVTPDGAAALAWERRSAGGATTVWFAREGAAASEIGPGAAPALQIESSGRAHLFFLRGGDIYYARESATEPGKLSAPVNVTQTPEVAESAPQAAALEGRRIYLCYERGGKILLADDRAADLTKTVTLAEGGAHPSLFISPNGALSVIFEKDGDLWATLGSPFFLPPPIRVFQSAEAETHPVVAVDSFANTHVAFVQGSELFTTSNAGVPQARFDASTLRGEAPLTVSFTDQSGGDVTGWSWEFGDGGTSSERNPVHTFETTGDFRVRLRVRGPGGESPITHERSVLVLDPSNEMHVSDVAVFPGQQGVHLPVIVSHDTSTQGYTIAAVYDPSLIKIREVAIESSNLSGIGPELFVVNLSDDAAEPFVTVGILFDVVSPFDGREFPPGVDQRIANVIVDIAPSALPGTMTSFTLQNETGRPPLNNIFTVNGFTVLPILGDGGKIEIRRLTFPPPRFFKRGDGDSNGVVNLTDAITTLNYLFTGGAPPACIDAADTNDDGQVNLTDATVLLGFLFKSGSYLPPPFPDWGLDPTADELPDCLLR